MISAAAASTRTSGPRKFKLAGLGKTLKGPIPWAHRAGTILRNGNFEQTTNTDENVFIPDGELHIKPTLQDEALIYSDNVLNLTESGLCTGTGQSDCVAVTNTTNGTIVNPVKSGRITTKKGATIQYCK